MTKSPLVADDMPSFDEKRGELVGPEGEDYVIISAEALRRINKHEEEMFGSGADVIWYNSGKEVGRTDGRRFAVLMEKMEINEFADRIKDIYSRFGWGYVEYGNVDPDSGELVFTVRNSPLVRGLTSQKPRCWFVKGFVEGLVSALLGTEVTAVETKCEAVNRDHCEFKMSWKSGATR